MLATLALLVALPATAHAQPLIYEGPSHRTLLGGTWSFRQDDTFVGDAERWYDPATDLTDWTTVRVPHSWNATDTLLDKASVGWYRKDFTLPDVPRDRAKLTFWKVRFEGANYRTKVWLNGKAIGGYNGYFPFELDLTGLQKGVNTLVVKVSSLRSNRDLTHWRPAAYNGFGVGGWWNFGGLLREVYLRRIDTVDVPEVQVLPRLRKLKGPAKVEVRSYVRNMSRKDREFDVVTRVDGQRVVQKGKEIDAGATRLLDQTITIKHPRLWQLGDGQLYRLTVSAEEKGKQLAEYQLRFGVRKLEVTPGGVILLNGRRLRAHGASIHEDDLKEGGALSPRTRSRMVGWLRDLGANITRSHYPLHPATIEALDRYGILYWVDAPVYQVPNSFFNEAGVRYAAKRAVTLTVRNNINHPSIMTWSLANEPAGNRSELGVFGPGLNRYIEDGADAVHALDDTRFVSIDRQSRLGEPVTTSAYRFVDVLGVNDYFGWYDSTRADLVRPPTTSDELSAYLDTIHAANPALPLMITEFGAEAVRHGPRTQRGSYEFQQSYAIKHLRIHQSKPYVAGSIWWALRDFRVEPTWTGGAPKGWSTPPWNNKSLIEEYNARKPLYFDLRKRWR